jgi:hypothetical protein
MNELGSKVIIDLFIYSLYFLRNEYFFEYFYHGNLPDPDLGLSYKCVSNNN